MNITDSVGGTFHAPQFQLTCCWMGTEILATYLLLIFLESSLGQRDEAPTEDQILSCMVNVTAHPRE